MFLAHISKQKLHPLISPSLPSRFQFVQEFTSKNETVLEFLSPAVKTTPEDLPFRTVVQLDNVQVNLTEFEYHPDPVFKDIIDKTISAGSIVIVQVWFLHDTRDEAPVIHAVSQ